MALAMASSHSSRSVAELQAQNKSGNSEKSSVCSLLFAKSPAVFVKKTAESRPCRQDERALDALDVQLVLVGLLAGFTHLQSTKTHKYQITTGSSVALKIYETAKNASIIHESRHLQDWESQNNECCEALTIMWDI